MKVKLAIIDDEEKILDSLKRYFSLRNYAVDTFNSANAALAQIKQRHHKVVLTDINMPGIDGLDLLKRLKRYNPMIQVVIMTGNATAESVKDALSNGASGYVVKPFDSLQMLEKEIEKAVASFDAIVRKSR